MSQDSNHKSYSNYALGAVIWLLGFALLSWLDGKLDLANLALLVVLVSATAAMFLPWRLSAWLSLAGVFAFNWLFIPPRFTLTVNLRQHLLMLLVITIVNWIVIGLIARKRYQAEVSARHAAEANFLREWSDRLNGAPVPEAMGEELQRLLAKITGRRIALMLLKQELPARDHADSVKVFGDAGIEQRHALWYCLRNSQQLGRGTGFYDIFADVYLPIRSSGRALGAALISDFAVHEFATRVHLQAICDQFGQALERNRLLEQEAYIRAQAKEQLLRNNLLAAISHDYRTPLATIIGSASSLLHQNEKLNSMQQRQLAQRIFSEAQGLTTITSNLLQLARLDANNRIAADWQSVEEIIAEQKRRWRQRDLDDLLQIYVQADAPLIWCDAILIGQALENLVDNAVKYSPVNSPVALRVTLKNDQIVFSVKDTGPGIDESWREKIFSPFQRGPSSTVANGAGVGLALCRAVAEAHQGHLDFYNAVEGGACFELSVPHRPVPVEDL